MEFDATFLPADLLTNADVEAIPQPWNDAVPMLAAWYAFTELQNYNSAAYMLAMYEKFLSRFSFAARPGRASNQYGRW